MTSLLPSASCPLPSETSVLPTETSSPSALCLLPSAFSVQAVAQSQLNLYIQQQSDEAAEYEIDSVDDIFGKLYRVWGGDKGINLLGTFYKNLDGAWISQPCNTTQRTSWASDTQAVNAILAA